MVGGGDDEEGVEASERRERGAGGGGEDAAEAALVGEQGGKAHSIWNVNSSREGRDLRPGGHRRGRGNNLAQNTTGQKVTDRVTAKVSVLFLKYST